MTTNFRIVQSSDDAPIATVGDLVFALGPSNASQVQLDINPSITQFEQNPAEGVLQIMGSESTDESGKCVLDTGGQKRTHFCHGGTAYTIQCLRATELEPGTKWNFAYDFFLEEQPLTALQKTGSIAFEAKHENQGWQSDNNNYSFPPISHGKDFCIRSSKTDDGQLHLIANGPCGQHFHLAHDIRGLKGKTHVALTWTDNKAKFYVNGQQVQEESFA